MRVFLVCPAPPRTRHGNRVTALRWADILRRLGCRVTVAEGYDGRACELLIALHARKSAAAIEKFHALHPDRPAIVALTGTDLYRDLGRSRRARRAVALATRLIVLQPLGIQRLPLPLRPKARVIYQSSQKLRPRPRRSRAAFEVTVIGHLRPEKDPMRPALAARRLPPVSRIRILHVGKAMTPVLEKRARAEMARNPRYRWLGDRTRAETRAILARSRLMVLPSRIEGGANVVSEAVAASVPVLASRIPGSVGLLGAGYPGLFEPGDARGLSNLLWRAESDRTFYRRLARACAEQAALFEPARELAAWRALLVELRRTARAGAPQPGADGQENPTSARRRRGRVGAPSAPRR